MLIREVDAIQTKVGGSCRQVVEAVGLPWPTYQRWMARLRNDEPLVQTPGPKKEVQLSLGDLLSEVREMEHRRRNAEKRASLKRITWQVPGLAWAMDATKIGPMLLQQVHDLASRYRFEPFLTVSLSGEQVAEHLERIIEVQGPPLILKRDRGSNMQDHAVQAVLERHLIIPLDSPRRYPPYNGAIEYAQREIKEVLEAHYPLADQALVNYATEALKLNHRLRPCLGERTACAALETGREAMKTYTRPKRKEIIGCIKNEALDIIQRDGLAGADARDVAWRRAVESWLHRNGLISVSVNGKVLPCFP